MPRPDKVQAVEEIKQRISEARATFLTEYRGLTVAQQQQLRRSLRANGAEYKVVKMTLARRAAHDLGIDDAAQWLTGPTALAFANEDPVAAAKALRDFAREHERFVLKAGVLSGQMLRPEQVTRLADVEPRPVLLAKIAGAMQAPMTQMAGMLQALTRNAASMFSQLLEKRETAAEEAADGAAEEAADGGRQTAAEQASEVVAERQAEEPAAVEETADGGRQTAAEPAAQVVAERQAEEPAAVEETADGGRQTAAEPVAEAVVEPEEEARAEATGEDEPETPDEDAAEQAEEE